MELYHHAANKSQIIFEQFLIKYLHHTVHDTIIRFYQIKRFPFERNRDFHKNGTMISKVRTGDVFHPGLLIKKYTSLILTWAKYPH